MAWARAPPLWNRKKKMALLFEPMIHLQARKGSIYTMKGTITRQGNCNQSHPEDVRMLCNEGQLKEALHILHVTDQHVDNSAYVSILQLCIQKKALSEGKLVHTHINETGFMPDRFLVNRIANLYAKCGALVDARRVFDEMPQRDAPSWNVMIAAYSRCGLAEEALLLFNRMEECGMQPNEFTFASVLPACGKLAALEQGMEIHEKIITKGFQSDAFVESGLVDMYAKCGNIEKARNLFDKMHQRDAISWTAMIAGYLQNGQGVGAIKIFQQMQLAGVKPDSKTFATVLAACADLADLEQGMEIHRETIRCGLESDVFVGTALVDMYAKCGNTEKARHVFDKMHQRNAVSWNAMTAGYTQNGLVGEAVERFQRMPERDVASWTVMIAGYAQNGQNAEALNLFQQMQQAGVKPNQNTFASVLPACANSAALERGIEIHQEISRSGFQINVIVQSALVDMYAKCGSIEKAREVFDKMNQRNVVSWTAMIAGYVQNEQSTEALQFFRQMQLAGVKPDQNTFASVLPACADLAALEQGMEIHDDIIQNGFASNVFVENALIDMYAKCGNIEKARYVFDKMHERNVISWTAMIAGYAMHGCGKEALKLFEEMQNSGVNPNHITFVCVLSACCHAGLVEEGLRYFDCMGQYYHITPTMRHYVCMVDLLGRAGRLDEAQDFIKKIPIEPDAMLWSCLLGACRIHNNVELGEYVAERLFELEPQNAAPYVLLSNIYATAGRWDDSENVRKMMKNKGVKKTPGCSWIEVNKQVHTFLVGDRSHPQTQNLCRVGEIV
eukprot:Gb_21057 [translate_table: standard]